MDPPDRIALAKASGHVHWPWPRAMGIRYGQWAWLLPWLLAISSLAGLAPRIAWGFALVETRADFGRTLSEVWEGGGVY